MKLKNQSTFVTAFLFFIICSFYFLSNLIEGKEFLGLIAAIATIYFGHLKYKIEDDQMFYKLFKSFNKQYDGKTNDLFNEIRRNPLAAGYVPLQMELIQYSSISNRAEHSGIPSATGKWIKEKMTVKNKKIRLKNAKKTIEELEEETNNS